VNLPLRALARSSYFCSFCCLAWLSASILFSNGSVMSRIIALVSLHSQGLASDFPVWLHSLPGELLCSFIRPANPTLTVIKNELLI
jgi:hypothetical protein